MTDVFFCTAAISEQRAAIAQKTKTWWKAWCRQYKATFTELNPAILKCSAIDFNRSRRIVADNASRFLHYILTDDDCLPLSGDTIPRGLETLGRYGDRPNRFAILSAFPENATINPWTPGEEVVVCYCGKNYTCPSCHGRGHYREPVHVFEDLEVMEHVSVGGLRFCRRGVMEAWPQRDPDAAGYDLIQADTLRGLDWKVGYLQHVRYTHLGEGHSDLQDQWHRYLEEQV